MRHYCRREGKRLYCDKSLDSVHHLEVVRQIFPDTRYVLLFRHVMDAVASGLEASPWGFQAYGYLPFVQRSPDNTVAALVTYWLSHVDAALRWQEAHRGLCHRVRYEDLVGDPQTVMAGICAFLDVEPRAAVVERAFPRARFAKGPGDYKVTFTSSVERGSIGRGKRIPVQMIPPPLLGAVNEKLGALGYGSLDQSWNAAPVDGGEPAYEPDGWPAKLAGLLDGVRPHALGGGCVIGSFALVAQDDERSRWVVDLAIGTVRQGDGEVECVITGTAEDLVLLISGQVNAGVLLRSGRIRHLSAAPSSDQPDASQAVQLILEVLARADATPGLARAHA